MLQSRNRTPHAAWRQSGRLVWSSARRGGTPRGLSTHNLIWRPSEAVRASSVHRNVSLRCEFDQIQCAYVGFGGHTCARGWACVHTLHGVPSDGHHCRRNHSARPHECRRLPDQPHCPVPHECMLQTGNRTPLDAWRGSGRLAWSSARRGGTPRGLSTHGLTSSPSEAARAGSAHRNASLRTDCSQIQCA